MDLKKDTLYKVNFFVTFALYKPTDALKNVTAETTSRTFHGQQTQYSGLERQ